MQNRTGKRHLEFFAQSLHPTPFLAVDLEIVRKQYCDIRTALPEAHILYAVKANSHTDVVATLVNAGCAFDVASRTELDLCLDLGADPLSISCGNTVKRSEDIAQAFGRGVRLFAFDSAGELAKIATAAPGSAVVCRILVDGAGARWPLSRKFGCQPDMALDLLTRAVELGLEARGVSFHVGSQQLDPSRWHDALSTVAALFGQARTRGLGLSLVNLGGGFPSRYDPEVRTIEEYAKEIRSALHDAFGEKLPEVVVEPGRYIVGDAGVLRSRVLLVSRKSYTNPERWVYLDVGRFNGLAETENEAIIYPLATEKSDDSPLGPVVLAGPTCDSVDILYETNAPLLPLELAIDDYVDFLHAGAYTAAYSTVGFNGFPPLLTYCFGGL
ncbi:type III PLP-dependent enzyme [Streptomyces sp. NPDC050610]|uniref:type III PLP-dependent enzyme n=1 Tax=Streptomyces sp. NPDC050610 TaxID=3157097 RepID=UPI00343AD933